MLSSIIVAKNIYISVKKKKKKKKLMLSSVFPAGSAHMSRLEDVQDLLMSASVRFNCSTVSDH